MIRSYKYRIYPNKKQSLFLKQSFGCCRFIYNWALNLKIKTFQETRTSIYAKDICRILTQFKKEVGNEWLSSPTNESLQLSIRNMDSAFTNFFRRKKGFPKFKRKHKSVDSCQFINNVYVDFDKHKIKIPKMGLVKFSCSRVYKGKTGTLTITKTKTNKYYVSIIVDDGAVNPTPDVLNYNNVVGVDVGIKDFVVLSNGQVFPNMRYLEKKEKQITILQRQLSKKQKDSNRYNKVKTQIAKIYEKITNSRKDYGHKVSSKIIAENQGVIVEDLNIRGLLKNHCLAKSIHSVSWGMFFDMLEYKARWNGKYFIRIGRFEPSSKLCVCGVLNNALKLSDRSWVCPNCGTLNDRDVLAANNIKNIGLNQQNLIGCVPSASGVMGVEYPTQVGTVKRQVVMV